MLLWRFSSTSAALLVGAEESPCSLMAGALVCVIVADVVTGSLLRSNLSR
jgi:hypothetical protein